MKLTEYKEQKSTTYATNPGMMLYIDTQKEKSHNDGFQNALDLDLPTQFLNWTLTSECEFQCVDENEWIDAFYHLNRIIYTTKEVYDYWVEKVLEL